MTGAYLRRVSRTAAFYPVTIVYLAAAVDIAAIAGGAVRLDIGLALLGLLAVLVVLLAMRREVGSVHTLVNSQHDALVATIDAMSRRIEQLVDALHEAGVQVPHDQGGVDRDRAG
jgi:hypothetical protein